MARTDEAQPAVVQCDLFTLYKGPAPHASAGGHPDGDEPYGAPAHGTDTGVALDPFDQGLRYGTRGHDPSDPRQQRDYDPAQNPGHPDYVHFWPIMAIIGVLKRAWEYPALLNAFQDGVKGQGLIRCIQSMGVVTTDPGRIPTDPEAVARLLELVNPDPQVALSAEEQALVARCMASTPGDITDAQMWAGLGLGSDPACAVLELLKRIHRRLHSFVTHCK